MTAREIAERLRGANPYWISDDDDVETLTREFAVLEISEEDRAVLDAADNWLERGSHDSIYSERLAEAVRARRKDRSEP